MKALAIVLALTVSGSAFAQTDAPPQPTLVAQLSEMLHRESDGHSPTPEEIQAVEALPGLTDPAPAKELLPLLAKALADPDAAIRAYGLAMLVGMQALPEAAAPAPLPSPDVPPAPASTVDPGPKQIQTKATPIVAPTGSPAYKGTVGQALTPLLPAIAARLTDDDTENRTLAATVLAGFTPNPPPGVYPPLLAFLKRDDAAGPVGVAVVSTLLQLGPIGSETASAISHFVLRNDLTPDTRASLVEAIAAKPNQSQPVNRSLLGYLDSDDAGLRSRLILSLPALDLSANAFQAAKARVSDIASGGQDSLQVVNAAKAVSACWTQVKMTSGCPAY